MLAITTLLAELLMFAQEAPAGGEEQPPVSIWQSPMIPLLLMMVVFFWIMSRGRSKERKRFEAMLNSLERNDRVQTIGGILGTVVDTRENEVVLKVDETSNVKMRFTKGAIKEVYKANSTETRPGG